MNCQRPSEPAQAVLAVNRAFYESIRTRDFASMESVWEHSRRATCVHPQWPILRGWDAVANSWLQVLSGPIRNQLLLTNFSVSIEGELAWVVLDEDVFDEEAAATVTSTNMYARTDGEWRLILHHGSLLHADELQR